MPKFIASIWVKFSGCGIQVLVFEFFEAKNLLTAKKLAKRLCQIKEKGHLNEVEFNLSKVEPFCWEQLDFYSEKDVKEWEKEMLKSN